MILENAIGALRDSILEHAADTDRAFVLLFVVIVVQPAISWVEGSHVDVGRGYHGSINMMLDAQQGCQYGLSQNAVVEHRVYRIDVVFELLMRHADRGGHEAHCVVL